MFVYLHKINVLNVELIKDLLGGVVMNKYLKKYVTSIALAVTLFYCQAYSTDYYVDRNNGSNVTSDGTESNPWETISFALSQITGTGHTVHVAPGVYDLTVSDEGWCEIFPITVKDGISLMGAGADTTLIVGDSTSYVLLIKDVLDSSTTIKGFSIKGGDPAGIRCENANANICSCHVFSNIKSGVSINQSSDDYTLRIESNTIQNNTNSGSWSQAYGISCSGGCLIIINNTIQYNTTGGNFSEGYGILSSNCKRVEIYQNQISNNRSTSGGFPEGYGIIVNADSIIIVDNTIEANYTSNAGAGIICTGDYARVDSNIISGNREGIRAYAAYNIIRHNTILDNHLTGIVVTSGWVEISYNLIFSNDDYGVNLSSSDSTFMYNNTIHANNGGISISQQGPFIINNIISENTGYGIYETGENSDPDTCAYNCFYGNTNLYYDEGLSAYSSLMMLETLVSECSNNLAGDPLFVDPGSGDFHLSWVNFPTPDSTMSPCINAGDPDLDGDGISWIDDPDDQDPDSTRMDIGAFYYPTLRSPVIESFSPTLGSIAGGTSVTINGLDFGDSQGSGYVTFGNSAADSYTSWSDTQIVCVTPSHAGGTVDVVVTSDNGMSDIKTSAFTFINEVTIPLETGWNWVSWNVEPDNDSTTVLFGDVMTNVTIVLGFEQGGKTFDPELPQFSDLMILDPLLGYQAYMNALDTLCIVGIPEEAPYSQICMHQGWNWISYLPIRQDSLVHALGTIYDNIEVVLGYDNGGQTYDPSLPEFSDLHVMNPGFMYEIYMNAEDTLVYPDESVIPLTKMVAGLDVHLNRSEEIIPSNEWIAIYGKDLERDGRLLEVGTCITVKDPEGTDCGAQIIEEPGMLKFMPVYRDDPRTKVDEGANPGDELLLFVDNMEVQSNITWTKHGDRIALTGLTGIERSNDTDLPKSYDLSQNYPNPFNMKTIIKYDIPRESEVTLDIYNIMGQSVVTLVSEKKTAGRYQAYWDGTNDQGTELSSGIYLCRLVAKSEAGTFVKIKRLVMLK